MKSKIFKPLVPVLLLLTPGLILTASASGDLRAEAGIAIRNIQSADSTDFRPVVSWHFILSRVSTRLVWILKGSSKVTGKVGDKVNGRRFPGRGK